jgi:DNA-binding transcriptional MocR family regulator
MTITLPPRRECQLPLYLEIAAAIEREVQAGRLPPGSRLPPQRDLADRLGVTLTTVTRAYAEARRRGLISGEVGRGTYACAPPSIPAADREPALVDLGINSLMPLAHTDELADRLRAAVPRAAAATLFDYQPYAGTARSRAAGAAWLTQGGLETRADQIVVTAGGQHAILLALLVATQAGDEVLVEEFTYAGAIELAGQLQRRLRPLSMDEHGLRPDALDAACRSGGSRVLYTMPTLQNPTAAIMPPARRQEIAEVATQHGLTVIEDDVYGYLAPGVTPLAALLPDAQSLYVTSTSKSLAPGMRIGYLRAPVELVDRLAAAAGRTIVNAPPVMAELVTQLITDGTAGRVVEWKRKEVAARQAITGRALRDFAPRPTPASPHVWLPLPVPWLASSFVAHARQMGIRINASDEFAAGRQTELQAIRICIGPPASRAALEDGLARLAGILAPQPAPDAVVV